MKITKLRGQICPIPRKKINALSDHELGRAALHVTGLKVFDFREGKPRLLYSLTMSEYHKYFPNGLDPCELKNVPGLNHYIIKGSEGVPDHVFILE